MSDRRPMIAEAPISGALYSSESARGFFAVIAPDAARRQFQLSLMLFAGFGAMLALLLATR